MYEGALQDLIDELGQLPGVGPKSAQRMALHLLEAEPEDVERLTTGITPRIPTDRAFIVFSEISTDNTVLDLSGSAA